MKPAHLRLSLIAGVMAPLLLVGASFAQDRGPPPPPEHGGPGGWDARPDPAEREAHRAQRLRDLLQLRPEQEPALSALLEASRPPADLKDRMRQAHEADEHATTPERLDHMLAHLDQMRAMLVRYADAAKTFYAQLSPAQQKAFDALGPMGGRHHHGMGGHDHGGAGHGMGHPPDAGPHG